MVSLARRCASVCRSCSVDVRRVYKYNALHLVRTGSATN